MYTYGKASLQNKSTCHPDIQAVLNELIKIFDHVVLCGQRGEEEQNKAYAEGKSKLKFPQSKHNKSPSMAVDLAPYPIDWNDKNRFYYMQGLIRGIATQLKERGIITHNIRGGHDFNRNNNFKDDSFIDLVHVELE